MFLNDNYCLFRKVMWDVKNFCAVEENCVVSEIFENMEKNAFNMITQVSSTVSIFKQTSWADMDLKHKGYALNQLGHSITSLTAGLIGFDPAKVPDLSTV